LQHLLRIFENVTELVALASQHLGGQLCRDFDPRNGLIFRYKPDLIDSYAGIPGQSGFQLFGQSGSFGAAGGERPDKPRELCLRGVWREVNAGNPRRGQELRKTSLSGRRT
jgi:hypothetical protein